MSRAYQKHELMREHGERQAQEWLTRRLKAGGLRAGSLARVKGSDPRKVLLADLQWRRTVISQEWLAEKLEMKSAANVSQQLRRLDEKASIKKVLEELKHFMKKQMLRTHECELFVSQLQPDPVSHELFVSQLQPDPVSHELCHACGRPGHQPPPDLSFWLMKDGGTIDDRGIYNSKRFHLQEEGIIKSTNNVYYDPSP